MKTQAKLAGLMLALMAGAAHAEAGDILVRLRAVRLEMDNSSTAIPSLAVPSDAISVNSKWIPELDISYFFTKHIAAELVLTIPQKQSVYLSGTKIGTFKHLPPCLTAQYHFLPDSMIDPYVGAGLNLTLITDRKLSVPGVGALTLDSNSVGPVLQAGVDIAVAPRIKFNLDVKKVWLNSNVKLAATGAKVSKVDLNPWLLGVGVGYAF